MQPTTCPLCEAESVAGVQAAPLDEYGVDTFGRRVRCPDCGDFAIEEKVLDDFKQLQPPDAAQRRIALAYALRRMPTTSKRPYIDTATAVAILDATGLPRPHELLDALIDYLGRTLVGPGQEFTFDANRLRSAIGVWNALDVDRTVNEMQRQGFLGGVSQVLLADLRMCPRGTLTSLAWARYDELQRTRPDSRQAFFASQWGDHQLDEVYSEHFSPAVQKAGFQLVRLSDSARAGLIDDRLRVDIRRSRFLVADLTHANRGAYWEAGFAEGLGLPVIYTCRKSEFESPAPAERPHFDTNHHLTVVWDPLAPQAAAVELKAVIRATLPAEAVLTDPSE